MSDGESEDEMEFGERMTKEVQMVRKEFAHRSAKVEDKVEIPEALVDSPRKASRGTNNAKAKDASFYCCVGPTAHKDEEFALMSSWEVLMKSQLASQKMDCAWLLQRSRLGNPDLERS